MKRKFKEKAVYFKGDSARGFTTIENYVITFPYMSPQCRAILVLLFMYQNCEEIFLSYRTISMYTGIMSDTTITKWFRFMEWIGFLDIERYVDEKNCIYNTYRINHFKIKDIAMYLKEVDITFRDIEEYWNKNAASRAEAKNLLKDKSSFIEAMKKIMFEKEKAV